MTGLVSQLNHRQFTRTSRYAHRNAEAQATATQDHPTCPSRYCMGSSHYKPNEQAYSTCGLTRELYASYFLTFYFNISFIDFNISFTNPKDLWALAFMFPASKVHPCPLLYIVFPPFLLSTFPSFSLNCALQNHLSYVIRP